MAWKIVEYLEKTIFNQETLDLNLLLLIFFDLKVFLLMKQGFNEEALTYLPIFGEYLEDNNLNSSDNDLANQKFTAIYYYTFGCIYQNIGDYNQAFEFYQKALKILNNNDMLFQLSAEVFNKVGEIFLIKGEIFHADYNFNVALAFSEKNFYTYSKLNVLINLIEMNLFLGNTNEVENLFKTILPLENLITDPYMFGNLYLLYFIQKIKNHESNEINYDVLFSDFRNKLLSICSEENQYINLILKLGESIYLNYLNQYFNIEKSKDMLENIIFNYYKVDFKLTIIAMKELCDIFFKEIKYLKNMNSFYSFQKLLKNLTQIAKTNHLYPLLVEIYILQSKIHLLFNEKHTLQQTELFLILAQLIAEEKNLRQLTSKVLKEKSQFKHQVNRWKSLLPPSCSKYSLSALESNETFLELKKLLLLQKPSL
jgi:tetratricopeptide (TPR) repeat protein